MTRLEIVRQGNVSFSWYGANPMDFKHEVLIGRTFDLHFTQELLVTGCVLQPIILTKWEDNIYLIDGRKRIQSVQWILGKDVGELGVMIDYNHKEAFAVIWAKLFYDICPTDQAVWAIVLNEERSSNPVQTWLHMMQLQQAGRLDEMTQLYKLNKQMLKSMSVLGDLKDPDFWIGLYSQDRISTANLFSVAKLPIPLQDEGKRIAGALKPNKPFSAKHIRELRTVRIQAALRQMPTLSGMQMTALADNCWYVIMSDDVLIEGPFQGRKDPGQYDLYQLVKVV